MRELISNANDALEKLRLTALTDKGLYNVNDPMNITIKAVKDESGSGGRLIITGMTLPIHTNVTERVVDTGIGMTPEELSTNLVSTLVCCLYTLS